MAKLQQVDSPLFSDPPSSDSGRSVPVKCGSVLGVLHLDKLNVSGGKVGQKCILSDSVRYSYSY